MAVYIDRMNAPFGRMFMCHMMADTTEELLELADKIGVKRKWIQDKDTYGEHFDICLSKKAEALALGAIEVGWRGIHSLMKKKAYMWLQDKEKVALANPKDIKMAKYTAGITGDLPLLEQVEVLHTVIDDKDSWDIQEKKAEKIIEEIIAEHKEELDNRFKHFVLFGE